ncbi:hypothetical protein K0H71_17740 [Bacillus sp. IITD106]|nr:hypothetical protein [Bacillus sp. IITD106]
MERELVFIQIILGEMKMFDVVGAIINIIFFVLVIYVISRVAHFFNHTKSKLNEIDKKIDEIKEYISNNDN